MFDLNFFKSGYQGYKYFEINGIKKPIKGSYYKFNLEK